jgi:hypothetical protein
VGASLVPRDEFAQLCDTGVPLDPNTPENEHVLILYTHSHSLPRRHTKLDAISTHEVVNEATENCHIMKVVLAAPPATHAQSTK